MKCSLPQSHPHPSSILCHGLVSFRLLAGDNDFVLQIHKNKESTCTALCHKIDEQFSFFFSFKIFQHTSYNVDIFCKTFRSDIPPASSVTN